MPEAGLEIDTVGGVVSVVAMLTVRLTAPEVVLLFGGEQAGRREQVLRLRGTARCHEGLPPWPVLLRIFAKYYVSLGGLPVELRNAGKWALRMRYYGQVRGGPGYISVVPGACEFLNRP